MSRPFTPAMRGLSAAPLAVLASIYSFAAPAWAAAPQAVDTVIVTAVRMPQEPAVVAQGRERLARTPGAVAVVANETFEQRVATGFMELLRDVPGVLVQKRYGEESRLSIRGSGIGQSFHQRGVLFAQDGVPYAEVDGFADFQKIDPLSTRYIEVYKGGNALRFGGAQLGGAINLVTPTGRTAQSPVALRVEGGSFDTARLHAALAHSGAAWDVYSAVSGLRSDGYRDQSEQDQIRGLLNVGYALAPEREIRLLVQGANIDQEVPGTLSLAEALRQPENASVAARTNRWKRNQDIGRISLQTHWRISGNSSFTGALYATETDLRHPIAIVIDQQSHNQGAFGRFDLAGELFGHAADLYWGLYLRDGSLDQQIYTNIAGDRGIRTQDATQAGTAVDVFAEGRWFMSDEIAWVAGASYGMAERDYRNHLNAANDASRDYDWLAPRVGLLWQSAAGDQIYGNLTRSVEPPHFGALVQSPYPGFVPLDPQKAWTAEVGMRGRRQRMIWDVVVYRSRIENELLAFSNAFGLPSAFANANRTVHQGAELAVDIRLFGAAGGHSLSWRQTYAYSDFRFDADATYGSRRLPVIPEHVYRSEWRYEFAAGRYIAPSLEWRIGETQVDYMNTLRAPGYAVWSLNAGWQVSAGITVFADLRNLTDKRYAPEYGAITNASMPGANTAVFYPGEGRALLGGLTWRF